MPKHGESRQSRQETTYGPDVTYVTFKNQIVYQGPSYAATVPFSERWCEYCQEWVECRDLISRMFCPGCEEMW